MSYNTDIKNISERELKVLNLGELQKFRVYFTMKDMTPKVKLDSDALV